MKKYVKPELILERFELTEQIASCKFDSNNTSMDVANCWFTGSDEDFGIGHGTYFIDSNVNCTIKFEGYCYHASTNGGLNLFNS